MNFSSLEIRWSITVLFGECRGEVFLRGSISRRRQVLQLRQFSTLGAGLLIAVTALVIYWPSLHGDFIIDDERYVTNSPLISSSDGLYRMWFTNESLNYYPVSNSSFWIEWRLWRMNSTGYHVTNLLLHLATAFLVWRILRNLSIPGAFVATFVFVVHPMNVEGVAWISQRKGLLAALFSMASILWYLRWEAQMPERREKEGIPEDDDKTRIGKGQEPGFRGRGHWGWLSLLAFVLAMLSKGSAATLPFVLALIVWWRNKKIAKHDWRRLLPFFCFAGALTLGEIWWQTHGDLLPNAGLAQRLAGAGAVAWFYLSKALLPIHLSFFYPRWNVQPESLLWWLPVFAAMVVTGLLCRQGHLRAARWRRPVFFAWATYVFFLLPVLGIAEVGYMIHSLVANHYSYLAMISVSAAIGTAWSYGYEHVGKSAQWFTGALAVALISTLAFLAWRQTQLYTSPVMLYRSALADNPESFLAHIDLGNIAAAAGETAKATKHYQQSVRLRPDLADGFNNLGVMKLKAGEMNQAMEYFYQALQVNPEYVEAHINLGNALLKAGKAEQAIEQFRSAILLKPHNALAHFNLGNALTKTGHAEEAVQHYLLALKIKPDYADVFNNMGGALLTLGRFDEAIESYRQAVRLDSNFADAYNNLGITLRKTGHLKDSIEPYRQALRIRNDWPEAHNNLGDALLESGRFSEAIKEFSEAVRLKPDFTIAYFNLGNAYLKLDELEKSIGFYEQALRLQSDFAEAHYNLGTALAQIGRLQEAEEHFQDALRNKPDFLEAQNALDAVRKQLATRREKMQQSSGK